jgi:hypothetical protein
LDEKQEALSKRQMSLLSEWQIRKSEVSAWISDMAASIKSHDSSAPDMDNIKSKHQDLMVLGLFYLLLEQSVI